jgi:dihydroorotase
MKVLEGVFVDSHQKKRRQIVFDETTGLIEDFGELGIPRHQVDIFYDDDCLVFPGMGDVHVHAREDVSGSQNYKEDFLSASKAAINGGVSFFFDMPNNPIPPIDASSFEQKFQLTKKGLVPIVLYAGIGPGTSPLPYKVPYKAYMGPSVGDLFFKDDLELEQSIQKYRGQHVSFHCEDPVVLASCEDKKEHAQRRPVKAEILATDTALKLIEKYELQGKLCKLNFPYFARLLQ